MRTLPHQYPSARPPRRSGMMALAAAALAVSLAACQGENADDNEGAAGDTAGSAAAADTGQAMQGMQGMGGMQSGGMMDQMQSHMRMMEGAGADSMRAMVPMHRQMVANMISQFDREMREMNMKTDAAWQATIDSLRQDNIRLPEMSASELRTFMPEHRARVMRLMEMHRSMMAKM